MDGEKRHQSNESNESDKQEELFELPRTYSISAEEEAMFNGIDLGAFGEALEKRDKKLSAFVSQQIEKSKGDGVMVKGLENLLERANNGTLALELEIDRLKRNRSSK